MTFRNRRATDPYGRWCGGRELKPPAYPILSVRRTIGIREPSRSTNGQRLLRHKFPFRGQSFERKEILYTFRFQALLRIDYPVALALDSAFEAAIPVMVMRGRT